MTKTNNAASSSEMEELHKMVAKSITNDLRYYQEQPATIQEEQIVEDEDTGEQTIKVVEVEAAREQTPPALYTAAIKFLKDNDVTANKGDSDALEEMRRRVEQRNTQQKMVANGNNVVPMAPNLPNVADTIDEDDIL